MPDLPAFTSLISALIQPHSFPTHLLSVVVLLGSCALGTSSAQAACNGTETSQWCGDLLYDVNKYTCCNGNITEGSHMACCGTTAYNTMTSSCCNNTITVGLSQAVSYCCGSKTYNPLNQICCGGHIQNKITAQTLCCGSELFEPKGKLCCGPKDLKMLINKTTDNDLCCGNKSFNKAKQCCCALTLEVEDLSSTCCKTYGTTGVTVRPSYVKPTTSSTTKKNQDKGGQDRKTNNQDICGSNPLTEICCKGVLHQKLSGFSQCCGAEMYQLSEEGVLCCDGKLHRDQPPGSLCAEKVAYSPHNYTVCKQQGHLPAGQQCCGEKTFNPEKEICCNGHSHEKSEEDMTCCGSNAYSPKARKHKCCSGHLHDLTCLKDKEVAGCCGPLLLTNKTKQHCCHSAEKTLFYDSQPGHSCCGHWYYSQSLWSCCAGRLIPSPTNTSWPNGEESVSHELWLMDFSASAICTKTVLLGTVESVAVRQNERSVVLKYVLEVNTAIGVISRAPKVVKLDHCRFPIVEIEKTFLWMQRAGDIYEPVANVSSLASPIHTILSLCQSASPNDAT
ncbi:uncharacterized protein [Salminus brasiliensis]|uniref:uncharacterized protein n=1 Tax=Salminus brasiliensis TaxID=930266 RepID=UPI003B83893A